MISDVPLRVVFVRGVDSSTVTALPANPERQTRSDFYNRQSNPSTTSPSGIGRRKVIWERAYGTLR